MLYLNKNYLTFGKIFGAMFLFLFVISLTGSHLAYGATPVAIIHFNITNPKTYTVSTGPNTTATYNNSPTGIFNYEFYLNVSNSTYGTYLSYNGSFANFDLSYSNNTYIPAWIESKSENTIIIYTKLNNINTNSSAIINLNIYNKSTNLLSNSGTSGIGEAPELSPNYAEYDDGADVFTFYNNFNGTTLSSLWNDTYGTSNGNIKINNGITIGPSVNVTKSAIAQLYSNFEITKPTTIGFGGIANLTNKTSANETTLFGIVNPVNTGTSNPEDIVGIGSENYSGIGHLGLVGFNNSGSGISNTDLNLNMPSTTNNVYKLIVNTYSNNDTVITARNRALNEGELSLILSNFNLNVINSTKRIGFVSQSSGQTIGPIYYVYAYPTELSSLNQSSTVSINNSSTIVNYTLTTSASPTSGGTVSPLTGNYASGSNVTLSVTPNSGYQFTSWTGSGPGNYTGSETSPTITMNGNISEVANFENVYPLTVSTPGNGVISVKINGVAVASNSLSFSENVPLGDVIEISGTANYSYEFSNWTGTYNTTSNPFSFNSMPSSMDEVANFKSIPTITNYTLTAKVSPTGDGLIAINDGNYIINNETTESFASGTNVTLHAYTSEYNGYEFKNWTGVVDSSNYSIKVTMNSNTTETANFAKVLVSPKLILNVCSNYTYDNVGCSITASVNNTGVTGHLYINNVLIGNTTTSLNYTTSPNAGVYDIVFNNTANSNYTSSSISKSFEIAKADVSSTYTNESGKIYTGNNIPFSANIISINNQVLGNIKLSGPTILSENNVTDISGNIIDAGTYNLNISSPATTNYNAYSFTSNIIIAKATPSLNIQTTKPSMTYNGSADNINFTISTANNQLTAIGSINGVTVSNDITSSYLTSEANVGTYNLTISTIGNSNYTDNSHSANITISKGIPIINLNTVSNFTYNGNKYSSNASISTFDNQLSGNLYIIKDNVTSLINSTTTKLNYSIGPSAGNYIIKFNTTGNANYVNESIQKTITINKATPNATIKTCANYTYNGSVCDTTLSVNSVNSQLSGKMYVNNILENTSSSYVYKTASAETYNFALDVLGNNNYTSVNKTASLEIYKATPKYTLSVPSNFTYNGQSQKINSSISTFNNQIIYHLKFENKTFNSTTSINESVASAGNYDVNLFSNANNNYTALNVTKEFSILKAVPTVVLNIPTNSSYNGLYRYVNSSITTFNNQTSYILKINNASYNSTTKIDKEFASAGIYNISLETISNNNYTSITKSGIFTITKIAPTYSLTVPGNSTYNGTARNVISSISTVNNQLPMSLIINNNTYSTNTNLTESVTNVSIYNVSIKSIGNNNYTTFNENKKFMISGEPPVLHLTKCSNFTYNGSACSITAGLSTIGNQITGKLYINKVFVANVLTNYTTEIKSAGTYAITFNNSANVNYGSNSTTETFTISKAVPTYKITVNAGGKTFIINNTSSQSLSLYNVTLPFNISYSVNTFGNQLPFNLFLNNKSISNTITTTYNYNVTANPLSKYDFIFNTSGNNNYTKIDPTIVITTIANIGVNGTNTFNDSISETTYTGKNIKLHITDLPTNLNSTLSYKYINPPANESLLYTPISSGNINGSYITVNSTDGGTVLNYTFVHAKAGTYIFKLQEYNSSFSETQLHGLYNYRGIPNITAVSENSNSLVFGQEYIFNYNGKITAYSNSANILNSTQIPIYKGNLPLGLYIGKYLVSNVTPINETVNFALYQNGTATVNGNPVTLPFNLSQPQSEALIRNASIYVYSQGNTNYTTASSNVLSFTINPPNFGYSLTENEITVTPSVGDYYDNFTISESSNIDNLWEALKTPSINNSTVSDKYTFATGTGTVKYNVGKLLHNMNFSGQLYLFNSEPTPLGNNKGNEFTIFGIDSNFASYNSSKYVLPVNLTLYSPYMYLNGTAVNFTNKTYIKNYVDNVEVKFYDVGTDTYVNPSVNGNINLEYGNNISISTSNSININVIGTKGETQILNGKLSYTFGNESNTYPINNYSFTVGTPATITIDVGFTGQGKFQFRTENGNNFLQFPANVSVYLNNSYVTDFATQLTGYSSTVKLPNSQTYLFEIHYDNYTYRYSDTLFCAINATAPCNETLYIYPSTSTGGSGGSAGYSTSGDSGYWSGSDGSGVYQGEAISSSGQVICNETVVSTNGTANGQCYIPQGVNYTFVLTLNGHVIYSTDVGKVSSASGFGGGYGTLVGIIVLIVMATISVKDPRISALFVGIGFIITVLLGLVVLEISYLMALIFILVLIIYYSRKQVITGQNG